MYHLGGGPGDLTLEKILGYLPDGRSKSVPVKSSIGVEDIGWHETVQVRA
jgi:hypothetical protein